MPLKEKHYWATQLVRIIKAIRLLSREGGASNRELEEELGVGRRTVQRIKETLSDYLHMPLSDAGLSPHGQQRSQLSKSATIILPRLGNAALNMPELLALYVLRGVAGIYKGSSIFEDIDSAFGKIGSVLLPQPSAMLEKYARLFVVAPKSAKSYTASSNVIDELSYAILNQKICLVSYQNFSDEVTKNYRISPLHFFEHDGGLYLIAHLPRFDNIRTLAVERFEAVVATGDSFRYPPGFDAEQFLSSAFTLFFGEPETFRIHFEQSQARFIRERQWAAGQQIQEQPDGSIILTMLTSGGYDIKKWVLSYGGDAELLEPLWMRQEIAAELKRGMQRYQVGQAKQGPGRRQRKK